MKLRELVRNNKSETVVIAVVISLFLFNIVYVWLTDYTIHDWWIAFWEG